MLEDREALQSLYKSQARNNKISWFVGLALGFETITKVNYFKTMAFGWRVLSLLSFGLIYKNIILQQSSGLYKPAIQAYLRKYSAASKHDVTDIDDAKRKYFYIDTSEYMSYSNSTMGDEYHAHHGPQPEGESLNASWQVEVDKFLRGEPNTFGF